MLIIAGTVAFESKDFVSVAVMAQKGKEGKLYPTMNLKLEQKELNVSSDDVDQIREMYLSVLNQLRDGFSDKHEYSRLVQSADNEARKLMQEIQEANIEFSTKADEKHPPKSQTQSK